MVDGLGIRQRAMIEKMHRYGGGFFKPEWRLSYVDRAILESLRKHGIVMLSEGYQGGLACQVYRLANVEGWG